MNRFLSYEEENKELMEKYNKIKKDDSSILEKSYKGISIGDLIVFENNGIDIKGEIKSIKDGKYFLFDHKSPITFNQIIEHYPKNNNFTKDKKIDEDFLQPSDPETLKNVDSKEKDDIVVFFPEGMKQKEIDKILPNLNNTKYFIVEKNNELHIVKIKEGFEMKPFVDSIINHMLKNKLIKENISKMKVVGNNSFCIIKNSSKKFNNTIKLLLKDLLK